MNASEARRIALCVTKDLALGRQLTALEVMAVAAPQTDSFLPPLRAHDEEWRATIESAILQEADRA